MEAELEKTLRRVLCAVDALGPDQNEVNEKLVRTVTALAAGKSLDVDLTFVLTPNSAGVLPMLFPFCREELLNSSETELKRLSGLFPPTVTVSRNTLMQDLPSLRSSTLALYRHARDTMAELVVMGTHVRSGLDRFLIGSFTEAWLTRSTIPTLTLNPGSASPRSFRTILVPTDLSPESVVFLDERASFLRRIAKKADLFFHWNESRRSPIPALLREEGAEHRRMADAAMERLITQFRRAGLSADAIIDSMPGDTCERVLSRAQILAVDAIAIESRWHGLHHSALGKIPKQLVRRADVPVLVLPAPQ